MVFFTADLHLGHANIIRHCARPVPRGGEQPVPAVLRPGGQKSPCGAFLGRGLADPPRPRVPRGRGFVLPLQCVRGTRLFCRFLTGAAGQ